MSRERNRAPVQHILLTGFEPFGGASFNPSGDVVRALHGQTILGGVVTGRILPVVWDEAPRLLSEWLEELRPHVAIALGMARDCIAIETRATNRRHPDRRDNLGALPVPARALATTNFSTALPVDALVRALSEDGPVEVSEDAGGFLCEEVFHVLMSTRTRVLAETRWPLLRAGFIHVPNDRFIVGEKDRLHLEKRIRRAIEVTVADLGEG